MAKNTLCPNINSKEWQLLVQEEGGDQIKAFGIWENTGYEFPPHIIDAAANEIPINTEEAHKVNESLQKKGVLLDKARVIVRKKLARLTRVARTSTSLQEGVQALNKLQRDLQRLETDQALVNFVKASDRMISGAVTWIDDMESGKKELTLSNLKRVHEYTQAFEILEEMQEDLFDDPIHKEELQIISSILNNKAKVRQKFLGLSRSLLAQKWGPFLGKIEAKYRREAEIKFNTEEAPNLNLKGNDLDKARKDFIQSYMGDMAFKIKLESEQYVYNMLVRTVDNSTLSSWLVSPKDMNHDLLSIAVDSLDKADWNIMQKLIGEEKEANKLYQEYTKFFGKHSDPKDLFEPLLSRDKEGNLNGFLVSLASDNDKYIELTKGKYAGTPVQDMYNYLLVLQEKRDKILPYYARLGHKLPYINKGFMERIYANGVWHTIKEGTIDQFKLRADDTEFGDIQSRISNNNMEQVLEVTTNEAGEERDRVPIHYRAPIDVADRSYDVLTSLLMDYHNALNFKEKVDAAVVLEVLKEQVSEADIVQRTEWKKLIKVERGQGVEEIKKGIHSNLYKDLDSIIRHRVYGIVTEGDPQVVKAVGAVKNFTSFLMMAGNVFSGAANLLHGQTISWIETAGGETGYFSLKDRASATKKYTTDLTGILNDIGQIVPKSKTNLIMEKLNVKSDWRPMDKEFVEDTRLKRMAHLGILMAANEIGEHAMQSTVMYSVLSNIKVQNKSGSYLDKKGQKTQNRDEAMSLDEAMFVHEKGTLEVDPRVFKTELTDSVDDDALFKISQRVRKINRELYGNYDKFNKSKLKRNVFGNLVYHMRGWFIPSLLKRFRGVGSSHIKRENLRLDQLSYNHQIQEFEEGQYTTAIRFVINLGKEIKSLRLMTAKENWDTLTVKERGNIKKASLELGVAALAYLGAMALQEGADDDDEAQLFTAYLSRRLFSELTTFTNVNEGLRIFQDPAPILSVAEDVFELAGQSLHATERYKTGRRRGDLKIQKKLYDLIPLVKQTDKRVQEALLYLQK